MKLFFLIIAFSIATPIVTLAGDVYTPLARLPIIDYTQLSIEAYINALYLLSISVAAILAVLKITLAGVKYVMSDIVTQKGDAKKDIQGALFGLLIVMAAFIILNTINRDLTVFAILSGVANQQTGSDNRDRVAANIAAQQQYQESRLDAIALQQALQQQRQELQAICRQRGDFAYVLRDNVVCTDTLLTDDQSVIAAIEAGSAEVISNAEASAGDPTPPSISAQPGGIGGDGGGGGGTGCVQFYPLAPRSSCPTADGCLYLGTCNNDSGVEQCECRLIN
jgi:hypothetical protein